MSGIYDEFEKFAKARDVFRNELVRINNRIIKKGLMQKDDKYMVKLRRLINNIKDLPPNLHNYKD